MIDYWKVVETVSRWDKLGGSKSLVGGCVSFQLGFPSFISLPLSLPVSLPGQGAHHDVLSHHHP